MPFRLDGIKDLYSGYILWIMAGITTTMITKVSALLYRSITAHRVLQVQNVKCSAY